MLERVWRTGDPRACWWECKLIQSLEKERKRSCSVMFYSLQPHALWPTRLIHPRGFPGKNTGMGCHFLFQGLFPTQGSNPGLPHCRQTLYRLSHQGFPIQSLWRTIWRFLEKLEIKLPYDPTIPLLGI